MRRARIDDPMPSRWWNVTALEDVLGGRLGPEARLRPMRRDLQ